MGQKSLFVLLKENERCISPTERNVIDLVTNRPDEVVGLSIHELASRTFVSPSTISRLCRKIGLSGYKQFQAALVYDLAMRHESGRAMVEDIRPGDTVKGIMQKVTRRDSESIAITEKLNDPVVVSSCVSLMTRARCINLFGVGSSYLSARDLHYKLIRLNVPCNISEDWHVQLVYARNSTPDDLAIAFSYSGRTRETIRCVETARERGSKVVVVSRAGQDASIVRLADHALYVASTEPLLRSSATASRISQLAVVDILFAAYVNANYERSAESVSKNYIKR